MPRIPPPWDTPESLPVPGSQVNLFETATRLETLERAWRKVADNAGCAGSDGVTVERFGERAGQRLLGLMRRLRDGSYEPLELRLFDIPKPDGSQRRLAVPAVVDRIAQTAVTQTLTPIVEPELDDASYAYRPGRSVKQAVQAIARYRQDGFTHVVEGDIERYFDRVPHATLLEKLEILLSGHRGGDLLLDLIALWLEASGHDLDTPGIGIPQGSPLSPLLSNLYLDSVDEAFAEGRRALRLVRYGDDFVILCRREQAAETALANMRTLLAEHGLSLHPDKTSIVDFNRGFRFLGHLFVRSMVLQSVEQEVAGPGDEAGQIMRWIAGEDASAAEAEAAAERDRAAGLDAGLRILYLLEPGRILATRQTAFTVEEPDSAGASRELLAVPAQRIDRIEVGPACALEPEALRLALLTGTVIHHVNGQGATVGITAPALSDHAGLHIAQARTTLDPERRTDLARRLVDGRLRNQRAVLHRLNRRADDRSLLQPLKQLNGLIRKLPTAGDVPALLGHEGAAGALYWPALGGLVKPTWACPEKPLRRLRRPCPDPANVVLNYLAWLLARDVEALALRHGLHPGFGALHSARDGGDACVYDLMEIFRAPLAEGLAVYLFNNRILNEAMFARTEDGIRLARPGHAAIIGGYQKRLTDVVVSPRSGHRLTWRRMIEEDIVAYGRHCRGDADWLPYRMDY
ncbi:MAG: CRISPR-associated endonuclease Cas1 [Thalassobaculum sp.]|uniref:CRISPR-associated endonuclease Cas1 n=1 Tax=Thalassobaculum sp. TaxID=2022740 RepID=UPI0032ECDC52